MSKLYNEDGEEIEAFTKEEFDAEVSKAITEKDTKVADLEKTIAELNTKLGGVNDKETNFKALREAKEKAEDELSSVRDEFNKRFEELRTELNTSKLKEKFISIAGNEDDVKKLEHIYNSFQTPKEGEEDKRLENAIKLAGIEPKKSFNGLGSGIGNPAGTNQGTQLSEEQKDVARKLGIKAEDLKSKE